jgi:cytochrome c-type biogenesis protein CcmH
MNAGMNLFLAMTAVMTIAGVTLIAWPLLRQGPHRSPQAAVLAAVMIPVLVWLVYPKVSSHDWARPAERLADPAAETRSLDEAVASLEQKLAGNPADEQGWVLLGSSYLAIDRPAEAAQAYQRAVELSKGSNLGARLGAAEAMITADPEALSGAAGQEIEAILALDPRNPKALWYGGILALARGDVASARTRWRALLDLDPPQEVQQIIAAQLAQLDVGGAERQQVLAGTNTGKGADTAIAVQVSVNDSLRNRISPSAAVFIFVRDPAKSGPPLAVVRRLASELPLSLRIGDADLMLPGGPGFASLKSAALVARIANAGNPVAQPGDLYGEADWHPADSQTGVVSIQIDQVVGAP